MQKKQFLLRLVFFVLCACVSLGCYRMPTDEDFSVVPATNNPDVTREKQDNFMPSMGF